MSLRERLDQELVSVARVSGGEVVPPVCVQIESGTISVETVSVDQLACSFTRLGYATAALEGASAERIQQVASDLSSRLSYLLEPISPIEIDAESCVVQMRSNPPQKDDDGTRFYELVVQRGELALRRYAKAPGQTREVIPANVTREVLFRLAEDFVGAVA